MNSDQLRRRVTFTRRATIGDGHGTTFAATCDLCGQWIFGDFTVTELNRSKRLHRERHIPDLLESTTRSER
jgi:hypothetical protein